MRRSGKRSSTPRKLRTPSGPAKQNPTERGKNTLTSPHAMSAEDQRVNAASVTSAAFVTNILNCENSVSHESPCARIVIALDSTPRPPFAFGSHTLPESPLASSSLHQAVKSGGEGVPKPQEPSYGTNNTATPVRPLNSTIRAGPIRC